MRLPIDAKVFRRKGLQAQVTSKRKRYAWATSALSHVQKAGGSGEVPFHRVCPVLCGTLAELGGSFEDSITESQDVWASQAPLKGRSSDAKLASEV